MPKPFRIQITPAEHVTAMVYAARAEPAGIRLILGHGAGANQMSAFMVRFAEAFAARGIDTVTFNFAYTEAGRRLPDRNDKLESCYRAVIEACRSGVLGETAGDERPVIGGKSMGGRIGSQVAATDGSLGGVLLLGYPLHPPGQPDKLRTRHLGAVRAPMLFVQGSRDAFGTPEELRPFLAALGPSAELCVVEGGDHSYKVPKKTGMTQDEVYAFVWDRCAQWMRSAVGSASR